MSAVCDHVSNSFIIVSFFSTTADAEMATELHLTSPVRSFCVRASTVRDRNGWLDALNTAIEDHNSRKATFFNNDQRIECKMGKFYSNRVVCKSSLVLSGAN